MFVSTAFVFVLAGIVAGATAGALVAESDGSWVSFLANYYDHTDDEDVPLFGHGRNAFSRSDF